MSETKAPEGWKWNFKKVLLEFLLEFRKPFLFSWVKLKVVESLFSRGFSDGSQRPGSGMKLAQLLKWKSVVLVSHSDVEACTSALELSWLFWSKGAVDDASCAHSPPSRLGPVLQFVACLELAASMCHVGFTAITGFSGLFPVAGLISFFFNFFILFFFHRCWWCAHLISV